jgi:hypothetical protein
MMTYEDYARLYLEPYVTDAALQTRIANGIEQNRKGDCRVRLTDAAGKPLANTRVSVEQTAHAFRYGANIFMLDEFGEDALNVAYRDTFHRYFNLATVPFYWNTLEPERGNPRYAADSEKIYRRPAPELVPWSFELARKYFPHSTLVFNETTRWHRMEQYGVTDRYPLLLENALLKGASIDKIAIQAHLFVGYKAQTPEAFEASARELTDRGNVHSMLKSLDILGRFGLPLEISEITIPTFGEGEEYEQLQAEMLRLWYSAYFSHPQTDAIVYWNTADGTGFSNGAAYDENRCRGGLFHRDLTPKKSAQMLKHLFDEEWRTRLTVKTDENEAQLERIAKQGVEIILV